MMGGPNDLPERVQQAVAAELAAHRALLTGPYPPERLELIVKIDERSGAVATVEIRTSRVRNLIRHPR